MRLLILFFSILFAFPAFALDVRDLRIESVSGVERVTLQLSGPVQANIFPADQLPPRVVIDLPRVNWRNKPSLPSNYKGSLIRGMRYGIRDAKIARLVFDLAPNVQLRAIQNRGSQLSFEVANTKAKPKTLDSLFEAAAPKPVVIIDAGHGGQDPGTSGRGGTIEKQVTLRYAVALKEALVNTGRYNVTLTRSDDRYLFLRDRVKRARAAKGDIFISLHADSAPSPKAHGLSVYTISENASDKEAEALAAKENKVDIIGGLDLSNTSEDVAGILIDLAQRETRAKSAQLAQIAVRNLAQEVDLLNRTHRYAGFAVLKAPDIPSILVEIGFLTNPVEERQIQTAAYQAKVVRGLAKAVDSYFAKFKK